MKCASYIRKALGLLLALFTTMPTASLAQSQQPQLSSGGEELTAGIHTVLLEFIQQGMRVLPNGGSGGVGEFFSLIARLAELSTPSSRSAAENSASVAEEDLMEAVAPFGDIMELPTTNIRSYAPKWSIKVFDDGANPLNEENDLRDNRYAWGGDFNEECGIGCIIHSAGTSGYVSFRPTYPTMTCRDAKGKTIAQVSISDESIPLEGPMLGVRSVLVTGCSKDSFETVFTSVGRFPLVIDTTTLPPVPSTMYKATIDTKKETMDMEVLIPDVAPLVGANSVRALSQGFDGDDCHLAFAPLDEFSQPTGEATIWTMDMCAPNVSKTLTPTKLYRRGSSRGSLQGQIVWDFEAVKGGPQNGKLGRIFINLVEVVPDNSKLSLNDLKPTLFWAFKGDLLSPTVFDVTGYAALQEMDTSSFLDASALVIEPINNNQVAVCTLSGYTYQGAFASSSYRLPPFNSDNIQAALDQTLAALEVGNGQECYVCGTFFNRCMRIWTPGMVATTAYIWQLETCGDYLFFGTFDQTEDLAATLSELILVEALGLVQDLDELSASAQEGLGVLVLSLFLQGLTTKNDFGFDIWFVPLDRLGFQAFEPLVVDGFRGFTSDDGDSCKSDYWEEYDAEAPITGGARTMVCHTSPKGKAKLMVGSAEFSSRSAPSKTYVIDLDKEC